MAGHDARIIDVGAGASTLVDDLLASGYRSVTALDISPAALGIAAGRLGDHGAQVHRIAADVLTAELPRAGYDLWHDRALFHFLTAPDDRGAYRRQLEAALAPGGRLVMATFASDGPERCSALPVRRYDISTLTAELGPAFLLETAATVDHRTPAGTIQRFLYGRFRRM